MLSIFSVVVNAKGKRYGASVSIRNVDTLYQDVANEKAEKTPQFGILHTRPMDESNNRWRWWIAVNYLQEKINPPITGLYQEVQGIELRVVSQYAIASWGPFTPYMGAGISVAYQMYSNRWQVDDQGYKYGDQLEDLSQVEMGAVFALGTAIKFGRDPNTHLQLITQVSYVLPINEGLGGAELSLSFLF